MNENTEQQMRSFDLDKLFSFFLLLLYFRLFLFFFSLLNKMFRLKETMLCIAIENFSLSLSLSLSPQLLLSLSLHSDLFSPLFTDSALFVLFLHSLPLSLSLSLSPFSSRNFFLFRFILNDARNIRALSQSLPKSLS